MKKIICAALAMAMLLCGCSRAETNSTDNANEFKIAASFYPVYITALNIAGGIEGVSVENLVSEQVGCLHDYTLTTGEMKTVENCDVLIINGAGMEPFMDKISRSMPQVKVIDASAGIETIKTDGEENPHVWLDVKNAIAQLDTVTQALCQICPEHGDEFRENAEAYRIKLEELDRQLKDRLSDISGAKLVTFHEAFEYFARAYGLEIAAAVYQDEHTTPSPAQVESVIDLMRGEKITAIFTEPQYQDSIANTVAAETGAGIYTLDPCVSGDGNANSYIDVMSGNMNVLIEAFGK